MRLTLDYPPVWLAGSMAAMWGLSRLAPWPAWEGAAALWVGRALILAALLVMSWAALEFRRARTTIVPHEAPSALVTTGPFRFSRNPIYAADAAILLGWGLSLGALLPFAVVPFFVWVIGSRFISGEETRLRAAFPEAFEAWAARTRRWL